MDYIDRIEKMGACEEAIDWLREKNYKSLATAWRYCKRGDWMLWLVARVGLTDERHRQLVLIACDCADLVKEYRRPEDREVLEKVISTARAWTRGEATLEEVNEAARAAEAAEAAARAAEAAETLSQCADIVRKHLGCPEWEQHHE